MKTYKLKLKTVETLRTRRARMLGSAGAIYWDAKANRVGDVLKRPIWAYYGKPKYSLRTSRWKSYAGNRSTDGKAWLCDDWPLRDLGDAHDLLNGWNQATGYYADSFQNEVIKGRVLQLPARNGATGYLAGTYCTGWDGKTVYFEIYDDPKEAARAADGYAEYAAEESREFYAKDAAETQIEECHETAREAIKFSRVLHSEIRGKEFSGAVCSAICARILEYRETVSESMRRVAELKDNYWSAVE